jgi:hypothetical protein
MRKFHDWNHEAVGKRAIMSTSLNDNMPGALKTLRTQPLFMTRLDVRKLQIVGATPGAYRRLGVVPGGSFEGERLSGEVLETKDEALIGMTCRGIGLLKKVVPWLTRVTTGTTPPEPTNLPSATASRQHQRPLS